MKILASFTSGTQKPQPTATSDQVVQTAHPTEQAAPPGFTAEEHALQGFPGVEPFTFTPLEGSQEEILARHAMERDSFIGDNSFFDEGHHSMRVNLGGDDLIASEHYNQTGSDGWVTVQRNREEIYRIVTGPGSPLPALRGLWVYEDHWVLETAQITQRQEGNAINTDAVGQISLDGELLNDRYGYSEMFGFQLMAGRPFYFFEQDGEIGFAYDGHLVAAGYDEVLHYGCCSAGALNPVRAATMVAFFARRDGVWFYVEVGVYE